MEEFPAKRECMNEKTRAFGENRPIPGVGRGPAFPRTGSEVIRGLKAALDRLECSGGGCLTQKRFAELIGMPASTINDWYNSPLISQIKGFLCGLERLNEQERLRLLRECCRDCFRLQDPRLAHDVQSLNALTELVRERAGLTFIAGPSDTARTFLITAMGNSTGGEIRACGLDAHRPDTFVPVSGVLYLRRSCTSTELPTVVRGVWPLVANSEAQLLLFNGIWRTAPDTRAKIVEMAKSRNVVVADDFGNAVPRLHGCPGIKTSLILVNWAVTEGRRLQVRLQSSPKR
jgi:hypothetical protein